MSAPSIPSGFDFTDPALWETRNPVQEFAELRRTAPVWWNTQTDAQSGGFARARRFRFGQAEQDQPRVGSGNGARDCIGHGTIAGGAWMNSTPAISGASSNTRSAST